MIMSGWILPDYTEVRCKSCSNNKEHIRIVDSYLTHLKSVEPQLYNEIIRIAKSQNIPSDALDDIAVKVLGWIKVNDVPFKTIYYLSGYLFENFIVQYINLGFTLIPIYYNPPIIIPNPSLYL